MNPTRLDAQGKILAFAAVAEIGTGVALMAAPSLVATLLLGTDLPGVGGVVGRCFGIALVALGVACWPGLNRSENGASGVRGMLIYNPLIAALLAYVGAATAWQGVLLWPAVGLHAI